MRAKFLRDDIEYVGEDHLYVDATRSVEILRNRKMVTRRFWKKGAVVTDPKAFRLVQMGVAEPADAECEHEANMTPSLMDAAAHAFERLKHGIRAEDFAKYDRGELLGYNADGSDIPGPNAVTFDDVDDDEDDE